MANASATSIITLAVWALTAPLFSSAWGEDGFDSVRYGEQALTYSSGSIQRSTPQDGFVNVITGDNQTIGNRMILAGRDTLYLRLKNQSDIALGDLFTIYKRARKVFHPTTGQYLGYLINRLAVVQVIQLDKELTTVRVLQAYATISPGDPVMKFAPLQPEEETAVEQPSADDMNGRIVDFQSNLGMMNVVAQRNIVYLDRGHEHGLRPGDRLEIIRTGGNLPLRIVGELKILSLESQTATALVTKSTARILKGDRFRTISPAPEITPVVHFPRTSQNIEPPRTAPSSKDQTQNIARETRVSLESLPHQLRFESGEAVIRPENYPVLDELIAHLKTATADELIRIEGHADNQEIGPSLKSRYKSNWDLSKARAASVLRYLAETGGIDSAKLSSIGYGDTKPLASNATETGRQKNRRVDIILYSPDSAKSPNSADAATEQPEAEKKSVTSEDSYQGLSRLDSAATGEPSTGLDTTSPAPSTNPSMAKPSPAPVKSAPASDGLDNVNPNPTAPVTPLNK